jgi:hypothetical protein
MKPFTVSIVLYKTPADDIRKCMSSLQMFDGDMRIYVVDNSPSDVLREECSRWPSTEYVHTPANPGFGAAHNLAIRRAQMLESEYHLVLNADVSFDKNIIRPMLEYMDGHPEVGQMMPRVVNPDGSIQRLCKLVPTPADLLLRRFTSRTAREANNRRFELHESGYDKIMFVPYLSGCFMLLRQAALRDVGLFDERFFMYPEDIDLTRRMAERYNTIYFPLVSVSHRHEGASRKSLKMLLVHAVNMSRYFNKWGWVFDSERDRLNQKTLDLLAVGK